MKRALLKDLYQRYVSVATSVFSRRPIGTNVFEREWDALVLLDTCRVDALKEVAPEYDFVGDVGSIVSVGSCSPEWIACTFTEPYREDVEDTVYVTANAFAQRVLRDRELPGETDGVAWSARGPRWTNWKTLTDRDLLHLDQVWKYAPQPEHGHLRPEHVTERAIANARAHDPDRLIVHYSQPHPPYTANADREGRELREYEKNPREYLQDGGAFEKVWHAYLDNLRLVLDEVAVLRENLDADRMAISADHGDAFGEWGMYRHLLGVPHPHVKRVPWVVTSATDTGEYEPTLTPDGPSKTVEQQLSDLGYLDAEGDSRRAIHEANVPGGKPWSDRRE